MKAAYIRSDQGRDRFIHPVLAGVRAMAGKSIERSEDGSPPDATHREATDTIRRKLIKAGAIGVPLGITMQSSTAWAVSYCATSINRPTEAVIDAALDADRALILSSTNLNDGSIDDIIAEFSALDPGNPFPEVGSISSGEALWLLVGPPGGSCFASFCDKAIGGTGDAGAAGDILVIGTRSNQVCGQGVGPGG